MLLATYANRTVRINDAEKDHQGQTWACIEVLSGPAFTQRSGDSEQVTTSLQVRPSALTDIRHAEPADVADWFDLMTAQPEVTEADLDDAYAGRDGYYGRDFPKIDYDNLPF